LRVWTSVCDCFSSDSLVCRSFSSCVFSESRSDVIANTEAFSVLISSWIFFNSADNFSVISNVCFRSSAFCVVKSEMRRASSVVPAAAAALVASASLLKLTKSSLARFKSRNNSSVRAVRAAACFSPLSLAFILRRRAVMSSSACLKASPKKEKKEEKKSRRQDFFSLLSTAEAKKRTSCGELLFQLFDIC
jgi:hypothetical protein